MKIVVVRFNREYNKKEGGDKQDMPRTGVRGCLRSND